MTMFFCVLFWVSPHHVSIKFVYCYDSKLDTYGWISSLDKTGIKFKDFLTPPFESYKTVRLSTRLNISLCTNLEQFKSILLTGINL